MFDDRKWLIVGISGVTCAGKTTLTQFLDRHLNEAYNHPALHKRIAIGCSHVINQDAYFLPTDDPRHVRLPELGHNNWEVLSALDGERMLADIRSCIGGSENLFRASEPPAIVDVLLIEGFVIFNEPLVLNLCQLKFHMHLPYEKCFERRQRRTYDPPDVVGYFERCVWPMYMRNFEEYRDRDDVVVLNGELATERTCEFVLKALAALLATAVFEGK